MGGASGGGGDEWGDGVGLGFRGGVGLWGMGAAGWAFAQLGRLGGGPGRQGRLAQWGGGAFSPLFFFVFCFSVLSFVFSFFYLFSVLFYFSYIIVYSFTKSETHS